MVDRVTAGRGTDTLAVAIAAIMENTIDLAIRTHADLKTYEANAAILKTAGEDIACLAGAMAVLARRGETDG